MSTITFDTLKFANRLRAAGFSEEHAKIVTETLRDALADTNIAKKSDIDQLEWRIDRLDNKHTWTRGLITVMLLVIFIKLFF